MNKMDRSEEKQNPERFFFCVANIEKIVIKIFKVCGPSTTTTANTHTERNENKEKLNGKDRDRSKIERMNGTNEMERPN